MPHMRCEECGYAWSGPENMPLSRCPRCGRSDRLVEVGDAEPGDDAARAQPDTPAEPDEPGEGFTASTELALVAGLILLILLVVGAAVTLLFLASGAL